MILTFRIAGINSKMDRKPAGMVEKRWRNMPTMENSAEEFGIVFELHTIIRVLP